MPNAITKVTRTVNGSAQFCRGGLECGHEHQARTYTTLHYGARVFHFCDEHPSAEIVQVTMTRDELADTLSILSARAHDLTDQADEAEIAGARKNPKQRARIERLYSLIHKLDAARTPAARQPETFIAYAPDGTARKVSVPR